MRFCPGLGCKATVVRIVIASATSSASTALMKITANTLPISSTGLRRCPVSSGPPTLTGRITTVSASASSSGTPL
jgi:hypothetical protein